MLEFEQFSDAILAAAIEVHKSLGAGLLESCYEQCLCHELTLRGIAFRRQAECPVEYKGIKLECGFRIDILVEESIVLELKAVEKILPIHEAQLMTYLKLSGKRVGFILNFNTKLMKDGIVRRIV